MKTLLLTSLFLLTNLIYAQTLWVADNNPNAPTGSHIFSTVQEAVDAATDGDVIYITPSATTYNEDVLITEIQDKKLIFKKAEVVEKK
jgi:pectin methylesterase-like acyl-CoA thioesterase